MTRKSLRSAALLALAALVLGRALAQEPVPDSAEDTSSVPAEVPQVDTSVMEIGDTPSPDAILLSPSLVTINEIESTIDLPDTARLKESQEDPNNPKAAFSQAELDKIFSDKPRFIYFPEGVDPMIIPWVREAIVAEEMAAEAQIAFTSKDFNKARDGWTLIRDKYPNTKEGQQARERLVEIENEITKANQPKPTDDPSRPGVVAEIAPELPQWIRQNTNAILIEKNGQGVVVVQNEFLRVGDQVPRFTGVTVKSIAPSEVTYSYQERDFVLEVVGTF